MISFNLPTNYVEDPEVLIRRTKAKLKNVLALTSEDNQIRQSLTSEFEAMADKTLCEFSAPTTTNIRTGQETDVGDNGFELKPVSSTWCKSRLLHLSLNTRVDFYIFL
jgi:hypothetical protein